MMLGALGGVTALAMILSVRSYPWLVPCEWAVATAMMAIYSFGGIP
jgi:hypothetical protein